MSKKQVFDHLMNCIDSMDPSNIQAYISKITRQNGSLETIFNAIHEGILVIDRELHIRYHNPAAKILLGLPDNFNNLRIPQFLRGVDWRTILSQNRHEWNTLTRQELEIFYPVHRILQFYLVPHEEKDDDATIILHDVTESRKKTLQQIETEKMRMISLLAAEVAHEIGNPLNSIYLHLQLMERQLKSNKFKKSELSENLNTSKEEVERLDMIISQFLSALRPAKPQLVPIQLKNVLIEALTVMKPEIASREIQVKCEWPEHFPEINGDANQLKQALYNLIKNAIQAMPGGGELIFSCRYDESSVFIDIQDSGKGITADSITHIFEPYNTSKPKGSGLGLMVVERILRDHGGEILVSSTPGSGTTFTLRIPQQQIRLNLLPSAEETPIETSAKPQKRKSKKMKEKNHNEFSEN